MQDLKCDLQCKEFNLVILCYHGESSHRKSKKKNLPTRLNNGYNDGMSQPKKVPKLIRKVTLTPHL